MTGSQWRQLRNLLTEYLTDEEELKSIFFDYGVEWSQISGDNNEGKIRQMIMYTRKRPEYNVTDLFDIVQEYYPALDFTPYGGLGPQPVSTAPRPNNSPTSTTSRSKPQMSYENFDIILREELDSSYTVSASHDFGGGAQSRPTNFKFDPNEGETADLFTYLQDLVAEKEDITTLGTKMHNLLFPPAVNQLFITLRERLREDRRGVRIRLDIRAAASRSNTFSPLIHLPWEYCFDSDNNHFMGKNIQTPMVRYVPRDYTPDTLVAGGKLRILMVLSNPTDVTPLNVEEEERIMRQALGDKLGDTIELEVLTDVTEYRLYQAVNRVDPHVIHFVGHGTYEDEMGALIIEKDDKTSRSLTADQLADLVRGRSVKIVVLNACDTSKASSGAKAFNSTAVGLVYARIPAVIAMQFRVPDDIALLYTKTLYWQIAEGTPLDKAVAEMRLAVSLGDSIDAQVLWGIPTLYMRANDGHIWAAATDSRSGTTVAQSGPVGSGTADNHPATTTRETAPPPSTTDNSSTVNQSGGGININIGGGADISGNITLGNITGGDTITASGGATVNKVAGDQYNIAGDYNVGGSGKNDKPEPSLDLLIKQIQEDIKPLLVGLDSGDAEDIAEDLAEAHEESTSSAPRKKRIIRRLNNTIDVLDDNDLDNGVIKQLNKAIKQANKLD